MYDIFISHSSNDKAIALEIANRLQADGIEVWLDKERILVGGLVPLKVRNGLRESRLLLYLHSAHSEHSPWCQQELDTFIHRDPSNETGRFIILRIDESEMNDTLRAFKHLDIKDVDYYTEIVAHCESTKAAAESVPRGAGSRSDSLSGIHIERSCFSTGHYAPIRSLAISDDGRFVVSGDSDGVVRIWRSDDSACIAALECHRESVPHVAIDRCGTKIIAYAKDSQDKTGRLISWSYIRAVEPIDMDIEVDIVSLALAPDGETVVYGTSEGAFFSHVPGKKKEPLITGTQPSSTSSVTASGSAWFGVNVANQSEIQVWDLQERIGLGPIPTLPQPAKTIALSAHSLTIVAGDDHGQVVAWKHSKPDSFIALGSHAEKVTSTAVSRGGHLAVSGASDGLVKVWNVAENDVRRPIYRHRGSVNSVALSSDSTRVVSGCEDGEVRISSLESPEVFQIFPVERSKASQVAFTTDSLRVFIAGLGGTLSIWDLQTRRQLHSADTDERFLVSLAITPDGRRVAFGSRTGTVTVRDQDSGQSKSLQAVPDGAVHALDISECGTLVMYGRFSGEVLIWHAFSNDEEPDELFRQAAPVNSVALTADARHAIAGTDDGGLFVFDVAQRRCIKMWRSQGERIVSLAITPDGRTLVYGLESGTVISRSIESGFIRAEFYGHANTVWALAISPDGTQLVSGGADGTVRVWDLASGSELITHRGHDRAVWSVAWTSAPRLPIQSATSRGIIRSWPSPPQEQNLGTTRTVAQGSEVPQRGA